MINAGKISCSFSIFLQLSCNLEFHSWLVTVRGFYWSVMVLDHDYHLSALESSPLFLLNLPRPFHLILCCRLSFGPSSLLYFLYLHCFSDLTQPTPPFLLFLLPIHLLVLLPIIPYHLLLQLDPISEGEIPAAPLDFTLPHGPRSFFVLKKPIVAVWGLIFTQRTSIPAFKWSQLWKVIQSFDTWCLCTVLCVNLARASLHLFSASCFLHLSISVLWAVCVHVSTPPPLSLTFWNFNFWPRFKRMNPLKQKAGTLTHEPSLRVLYNEMPFMIDR